MFEISDFSERLKECMAERGLNAPALAKEIGAERSTVNGLERGAFAPSTQILIALTEYFNCSADYILGLADFSAEKDFKKFERFADRLSACLREKGITEYRLQKDLNLSRSLTYRWLKCGAMPRVYTLARLSEYFGCSVDFLLGRDD